MASCVGTLVCFTHHILFLSKLALSSDQFEVLKISNVPFPMSFWASPDKGVVAINASYTKPIPDYTICYRFNVESYNDQIFIILGA